MGRLSKLLILGLLALPMQAVAQGRETKVFKATSAWAVDYGDDYCQLMRDFSDGTDPVGLLIQRTQPGPIMRMIVIGDSIRLFRGSQEVGFRMAPSGSSRTVPRLRYVTNTGDQYLNLGPTTLADMPTAAPGAPPPMPPPYTRQADVAAAGQITGVALTHGVTSPILIETGALGEATDALQACADDLLASWGLDAEKHKGLRRPATPDRPSAGWIARDTVSFSDFTKLAGGNNELRVMVNAAGRATACHVLWPTLGEETNRTICDAVMENGTFLPALDQAGQAMDSYWMTSVFFLMPPFGS